MTVEIVKSEMNNDLEFYCSKDGSQVGMSQRGLAKFCGIDPKTLRDMLEGLGGNRGYKELEHLYGKDLTVGGLTSANNAKIIDAEYCQEIVWHYAINKKNPIALNSLKKFSEMGLKDFIRKLTGFEKNTVELPTDILQEILSTVKRMETKVEVLDKFNKATVTLPGLQKQFIDYSKLDQEHLIDGYPFSLQQWLDSKNVQLSVGEMCAFGRLVSSIFKINRQSTPLRLSKCKLGLKGTGVITVYKPSDVPMLEVALNQFLEKRESA